jgi:hypothetical protein
MVAVPRQAAEEAGLVSRVLVDPGVWDDCVAWTEADTARKGIALDEATRRADVLYLAACALKRDSAAGSGRAGPGRSRSPWSGFPAPPGAARRRRSR